MYGEAEALCEWLSHKGNEAYAWVCQAAIFGKTGRLVDCVSLCRRGATKYPEEKSFRINGARALAELKNPSEALAFIAEGLQKFPTEPILLQLRENISQSLSPKV